MNFFQEITNSNLNVEFFELVPDDVSSFMQIEFRKHRIEKVGFCDVLKFCFVVKKNEKIIGATTGATYFGSLHVDSIIVKPGNRSKNIGSMLLEKVLNYASKKKVNFVYLETLSFQALDFYKRFGFKIDFKRDGFNEKISQYYLSKKM